jgi:hypothetical protein
MSGSDSRARRADPPAQRPGDTFALAVNLTAFDLTIPPSVLARADEVIE